MVMDETDEGASSLAMKYSPPFCGAPDVHLVATLPSTMLVKSLGEDDCVMEIGGATLQALERLSAGATHPPVILAVRLLHVPSEQVAVTVYAIVQGVVVTVQA